MQNNKKLELLKEFEDIFSKIAINNSEEEDLNIIEDNTVPKNCILLTNEKGEQLLLKFNDKLEIIGSYFPEEYKE